MEIYQDNPDEPNFANVVEIVGKEYFFCEGYGPYYSEQRASMSDPHAYADLMHFL